MITPEQKKRLLALLILLILLLIGLAIGTYIHFNGKIKNDFHQDTNVSKPIEKIRTKSGQEINLQPTETVDKDAIIEQLKSENSRLRIASATVKVETKIEYRNVYVPFENKDTLKDVSTIHVPAKFAVDSPLYSIHGTITKTGIGFDSISFKEHLTVSFGEKKNENLLDVFKKHPITAEVITGSPHSTVTGMQSYTYTPATSWYQTTGFKVLSGAVGGVFLYRYLTK